MTPVLLAVLLAWNILPAPGGTTVHAGGNVLRASGHSSRLTPAKVLACSHTRVTDEQRRLVIVKEYEWRTPRYFSAGFTTVSRAVGGLVPPD